MSTLMGIIRKVFLLAGILPALIACTGCGLSPARSFPGASRYYLLEPTVFSQCKNGGACLEECKAGVSDACVLRFADEVKTTLRERMNNARLARTGGGIIQVLTAAISAMFTGTTGASALGTSTILSGVSAIIPDLSEVIGAKERAEAYSEGAQSIEDAQALYLQEIAEAEKGQDHTVISATKLTPPGAKLYGATVASIHVVEKALTGQIPSLEELQKMRGKKPEEPTAGTEKKPEASGASPSASASQ